MEGFHVYSYSVIRVKAMQDITLQLIDGDSPPDSESLITVIFKQRVCYAFARGFMCMRHICTIRLLHGKNNVLADIFDEYQLQHYGIHNKVIVYPNISTTIYVLFTTVCSYSVC